MLPRRCARSYRFLVLTSEKGAGNPAPFPFQVLAEGRCVKQTTVCPLSVEPASKADRRAFTDVLLEDFTVVAVGGNGLNGPVSRQSEHFAQVAFGAEQAVHFGAVAGCRSKLID